MDRPQDAPEGATSEQFTIVESDSSRERFLAGFIDAAHQLTTITVRTPNQVMARALLDDVLLPSGEEREIEPLAFWHSDESAARMASRFAAMLGDTMRARTVRRISADGAPGITTSTPSPKMRCAPTCSR